MNKNLPWTQVAQQVVLVAACSVTAVVTSGLTSLAAVPSPHTVNLRIGKMNKGAPFASSVDVAYSLDDPKYKEGEVKLGITRYISDAQMALRTDARYVTCPARVAAMTGNDGGVVHLVGNAKSGINNVFIKHNTQYKCWEVPLRSNLMLVVPQECGNLSIMVTPVTSVVKTGKKKAVIASRPTPVATTVTLDTPEEKETPATAVQAITPTETTSKGLGALYLIPVAVAAGLAATLGHKTPAPPCSQGSNILNTCQK